MPSTPARTAKSSSRSARRSDGPRPTGALPAAPPDASAIAVGELGSPHGLGGQLKLRAYQPGAPSLTPGRPVLLERDGTWLATTVATAAPAGRGMRVARG